MPDFLHALRLAVVGLILPAFVQDGRVSNPAQVMDQVVRVGDAKALREALAQAGPGTTIAIMPGRYAGGFHTRGLKGAPGRPIVIRAAEPEDPPIIEGGALGLQFSSVAYLVIRDLVIRDVRGNGLNIDDDGHLDQPSHHVRLERLKIADIGPEGNLDGIKLSGLDEFEVRECTVERWGGGGSGIDMVGCKRGQIVGCMFRHGEGQGGNGVQAKGGSDRIIIRQCRFENAGQRSVNIGGSTGLSFFRPSPQGYEAREVTVEDCTIIGSQAPVAFVGVDGAVFHHNTIYRPRRYAFRVLQETREPGFVPSRRGRFTENVVVFRSDEMVLPINVGDGTEPGSFTVARNAWYCLDAPDRSQPRLEIRESEGIYGQDPQFIDSENGDFRLRPESPLRELGARATQPTCEAVKESLLRVENG